MADASLLKRGGGLYKSIDNAITLYPNPTNGSLTVSFSQNIDRPYRLQFTDLYGRVVFTQNLISQENLLDLSSLAQGVYAYTLFAPDGSVSKQGRLARR